MNSSAQSASAGRVLLINLNHYDQPYPVYPLGLAYVDGALRAAGYTTRIWDVHCPSQSMTECATEFRPDFVGLSMRNIDNVQAHNPRSFTQEVLSYVRQLRAVTTAPLILGGCGFSIFPKEIFELTGVDYGIQGEGERTLVRLLAALRTHSPLDGIDGLLARHADGSVHHRRHLPAATAFLRHQLLHRCPDLRRHCGAQSRRRALACCPEHHIARGLAGYPARHRHQHGTGRR